MDRTFEEGTLLQIEGEVIKVEKDTQYHYGCKVCALNTAGRLGEYCGFTSCLSSTMGPWYHFIKI